MSNIIAWIRKFLTSDVMTDVSTVGIGAFHAITNLWFRPAMRLWGRHSSPAL